MGVFGDFTGRFYMTVQIKGLQSVHLTAHCVIINVTSAAVAVLVLLY
jgi:hypothetical protein